MKIADSVTGEQRNDPRFKKLMQDCEDGFNSPDSGLLKLMIGLHEGAHRCYAERAGATNICYRGPTLMWDYRYDCPAISRSAIAYTRSTNASIIQNVKISLAGYICRQKLSGTPNDQSPVEMDLHTCRKWFDEHVGTGEDAFNSAVQQAERELIIDLRSPKTRREIWDEARRFVREIFPAFPTPKAIKVGRNEPMVCARE